MRLAIRPGDRVGRLAIVVPVEAEMRPAYGLLPATVIGVVGAGVRIRFDDGLEATVRAVELAPLREPSA